MDWIDISDSKTRLFVAESNVAVSGEGFIGVIQELLHFVLVNTLGIGNIVEFDTFFIEVNCDTGRIIVSPSTEACRINGALHGCAVRFTKLQDIWYDLDEGGVSGDAFDKRIEEEVQRIGQVFENELRKLVGEFSRKSKKGSFEMVVFGLEPEKVVLRKTFALGG